MMKILLTRPKSEGIEKTLEIPSQLIAGYSTVKEDGPLSYIKPSTEFSNSETTCKMILAALEDYRKFFFIEKHNGEVIVRYTGNQYIETSASDDSLILQVRSLGSEEEAIEINVEKQETIDAILQLVDLHENNAEMPAEETPKRQTRDSFNSAEFFAAMLTEAVIRKGIAEGRIPSQNMGGFSFTSPTTSKTNSGTNFLDFLKGVLGEQE